MSEVSTGHVASIALYSPLAAEVGANGPSAPPSRDVRAAGGAPYPRACMLTHGQGSWPNLVEGFFSKMTRQTPRSDPGLEQGRAQGEDPALLQGGERRAGRLQVEVEPVGHRPDDRGARRGHPPFGWGKQGKLVAGRYGSRLTAPRSRAKAAITEVRQGWDHRWRHHRS